MASNKKQKKKIIKTIELRPLSETTAPKADPKTLSEQTIAVLRNGSISAFWITIKSIIQANIDYMVKEIAFNEDEEKTRLNGGVRVAKYTEPQLSKMRDWLSYQRELLTLPEQSMASLERGVENEIDLDPYWKVYEDIKRDATAQSPN